MLKCVLGVESSCDDTGLALYDGEKGLIGHVLHSQTELHAEYGGVVPELASRDHIRTILPLLKELMHKTGHTLGDIDAIAYTAGPGLVGALLVGASFARTLAYALGIPALGVHHMESHLLAPLLEEPAPVFPFIALLVSGGHTLIVEVSRIGHYQVLGESLDDAAGEAFDKTAKLLGFGYPGGPAIAKCAESGRPGRYHFPRPMCDRPGLDLSFSGLKTHTRQTWQQSDQTEQAKADIAFAFQEAVVDTLYKKCERVLKQTNLQRLVVAGGVSANLSLRQTFAKFTDKLKVEVYYPRFEFCADNGAMVAYCGYRHLALGKSGSLSIDVRARWPLDEAIKG